MFITQFVDVGRFVCADVDLVTGIDDCDILFQLGLELVVEFSKLEFASLK